MKTKLCYIAGKIGDLPVNEYTANFENAKNVVSEMGYKPIAPTDLPHDHDRSWDSYMKEDLTAMLKCDAVYALKNWTKSPGARIEVGLAFQLGLPIYYE
jgi:hypothetical protein